MKMDVEERQYIDKVLKKYPSWVELRRVVRKEAEWIESRYGQKSPSDFSETSDLGTRIDARMNGTAPQERIYEKKMQLMREALDYADILKMRIERIDTAVAQLPALELRVLEERYFKQKTMNECIGAIEGLTEKSYSVAVNRIREAVKEFILGVFVC